MSTARSSLDSVTFVQSSDEFLPKGRQVAKRPACTARIPPILVFFVGVLAGAILVAPLAFTRRHAVEPVQGQLAGELNGLVPNCALRKPLESWMAFLEGRANGLALFLLQSRLTQSSSRRILELPLIMRRLNHAMRLEKTGSHTCLVRCHRFGGPSTGSVLKGAFDLSRQRLRCHSELGSIQPPTSYRAAWAGGILARIRPSAPLPRQ